MKQAIEKKKICYLYHIKLQKETLSFKSMKKIMKCLLPTCILNKIAYVGNKLSTCFRVKDVTEFKDNHDIIYQGRCPKIGCNDYYLGETTTMQISSKFIWGTCELIPVVLTF